MWCPRIRQEMSGYWVTYPQQRGPPGFELIYSTEELECLVEKGGDRPCDTAVWSFNLQRFVENKSNQQVADIDSDRPYRPRMPYDARVVELIPGEPQSEARNTIVWLGDELDHGALELYQVSLRLI